MKIIDSVEEFLCYKREVKKLTAESLRSYKCILGQFTDFAGNLPLDELTADLLRRYVAHLCAAPGGEEDEAETAGKRPRSIITHWTVVKGFLLWLFRTERIPTSPLPFIELPAEDPPDRNIIFAPEVRQIMETVERITNPLQCAQNRAIVQVLASTGVRAGEACAIRIEDLRLEENHLIVAHGKGNKRREVPLSDPCKAALSEWLLARKTAFGDADSEMLFIHSSRRACFRPEGLRTRLCDLAKLAGIADYERFTCHAWRRFAAVEFYKATKDIRAVQMLLGHSSVTTTERYINLISEHLIELRGSLSFGAAAPLPKGGITPSLSRSTMGRIRLAAVTPEALQILTEVLPTQSQPEPEPAEVPAPVEAPAVIEHAPKAEAPPAAKKPAAKAADRRGDKSPLVSPTSANGRFAVVRLKKEKPARFHRVDLRRREPGKQESP